ncbi:hypothetical protein G7A66_12765 [Altererythrobacter sp. SALINAS58]|uniref:hypothetical protein n=1 Tax=Alteripontixanthobacter muriae TaxID=2705546 RepID=UPI0015755831|nr:hypothetical protein [Alteripontixanthobacter muriae]NTZ43940.1 hypothetical protein [Alteripontixanthobacter muriae]
MEKLAFGFNHDSEFYQDSMPFEGAGWLNVSAEENGAACRARFWTERAKMQDFVAAIVEKASTSEYPIDLRWHDELEERAFHLRIEECERSGELKVQLHVYRGADRRELYCWSFATSHSDLRAFNSAMVDMVNKRRSRAVLNGW